MASMNIKPYPMARAQTWGIKPFVIRPPTKRELLSSWISSEDFLAMPETAKRIYARKFQVPNYNKLSIRLLDTMFTKYNEKLPMMDILRWDESSGKKVLECTTTATDGLLEPRRRGPDDPKYAPWSRYSEVLMDEMLQPSPDDPLYEAPTRPGSPQADPEDHEESPNDIWLYDKLQDQETEHHTLVKTFQEALDRLRKAVTDVALLQEQIKVEKAASDCFLDAIVAVCGERTANDIVKQTERGIKTHNIFPVDKFSDHWQHPHLLGLQELCNKSEDGEESESLPVRHEDVIVLPPFAFGAHYGQSGTETRSMGAPANPITATDNDAQTSRPRFKRARNDESDEESDVGSVASLLYEEHPVKPPRKKIRSTR